MFSFMQNAYFQAHHILYALASMKQGGESEKPAAPVTEVHQAFTVCYLMKNSPLLLEYKGVRGTAIF